MWVLKFKSKGTPTGNWWTETDEDNNIEVWEDYDDARQIAKDRESHNLYNAWWKVEPYEE